MLDTSHDSVFCDVASPAANEDSSLDALDHILTVSLADEDMQMRTIE